MSFQPIIPLGGLPGWAFLNRTLVRQQDAFASSVPVQRLTEYFRDNISKATSAEHLVNDRRLLQVALGAFGLDDDIDARAFIRKVLEDGTTSSSALSSRLTDKRYAQMAAAFGYGDPGADGPATRIRPEGFADEIIARYRARQFESAVGEQDNDLRLALNLGPGLDELLDTTSGDRARWFALMGNPPLRRVFEVALGLPDSFGRLDIDQQLTTFRDRSQAIFGSADLADLASPDQREALTRRFLLRAEAAAFNATTNTASIALTLLSQAAPIRWPGAHAAYGAW